MACGVSSEWHRKVRMSIVSEFSVSAARCHWANDDCSLDIGDDAEIRSGAAFMRHSCLHGCWVCRGAAHELDGKQGQARTWSGSGLAVRRMEVIDIARCLRARWTWCEDGMA